MFLDTLGEAPTAAAVRLAVIATSLAANCPCALKPCCSPLTVCHLHPPTHNRPADLPHGRPAPAAPLFPALLPLWLAPGCVRIGSMDCRLVHPHPPTCLHAFFRALVDICCLPWCAPATHACSAQPLIKAEQHSNLGCYTPCLPSGPQPWWTFAATTSGTSCTPAARPACCRQAGWGREGLQLQASRLQPQASRVIMHPAKGRS